MDSNRVENGLETRVTPQELEVVLSRFRESNPESVTVADVAEALHCSPAEIEALVWRMRAETMASLPLRRRASIQSIMVGVFFVSVALGVMALAFSQSQVGAIAVAGLAVWVVYSTYYVVSDVARRS